MGGLNLGGILNLPGLLNGSTPPTTEAEGKAAVIADIKSFGDKHGLTWPAAGMFDPAFKAYTMNLMQLHYTYGAGGIIKPGTLGYGQEMK